MPPDTREQDLQGAIAACAPEPGDLLSRYVVIAEWMGEDGEKRLQRLPSDGQCLWDLYGFLFYCLHHWDAREDDE